MNDEKKSLWSTVKPDIVKLLTVGVLGSLVSGVFGYVTWVRDKRLARLEENIKDAEQIHSDAIALAHERWYRSYRLLDELAQAPAPLPGHDERLQEASKAYTDILMKWNIDDAALLSRIEMSVDSPLDHAAPVSLKDVSKVDCYNPFFRDAQGKEIPELDHSSVKAWHIGMSHCFGQLNDAIKAASNHIDKNGKLDNAVAFSESWKLAQKLSENVYVNASLYRTTFLHRVMELKAREIVYFAETTKLKDYFDLKRNPDKSYIPLN
jgi:hypothetical protein